MTREELGNRISANIASATMGCTNIEITSAIMRDVDAYYARCSEQAGDMVDKATAWDACIKAREEEREQRIKAEQDCEHWAKNYDEQGQSLIKWMDRALGAEARLREYEKLGTVEALRMFLTGLATGRVTTIADVVSSPVGGGDAS